MKNLKIVMLLALMIPILFIGCKKDSTPTPTSLELTLTDNLGNPISGASVKLYSSQTDWSNGTNQVGTTQFSGALGKVDFNNLSNIKYYWFAEMDCKNNVNGAITSTLALTSNVNNPFNVILSSTGTLTFVNTSSNPYQIYINGTASYTLNGGTTLNVNYMPIGSYSLRVVQLSGYAISPTDKTYTGTLNCGSSLTTTFP